MMFFACELMKKGRFLVCLAKNVKDAVDTYKLSKFFKWCFKLLESYQIETVYRTQSTRCTIWQAPLPHVNTRITDLRGQDFTAVSQKKVLV